MMILLAIAVFLSAASLDYCNTRYVMAVGANEPYRAGIWSVLQWCSSLLGFLIVVKVTLWLLPIEALGLYTGCILSMRAKVKKS